MDAIPTKHKALLVIGSSILMYCFNQILKWKRERDLSSTSDLSEDTIVMISEEISLDQPKQTRKRLGKNTIASGDERSYSLAFTTRNNCVIDARDEIVVTYNGRQEDSSYYDSSVISPERHRKVKNTNRENNAKKFLCKLGKTKSKAVKKKLAMEEYYAQLKNKKGYVKIGHQKCKGKDKYSDANGWCSDEDSSLFYSRPNNNLEKNKVQSKECLETGIKIRDNEKPSKTPLKLVKTKLNKNPKQPHSQEKDIKLHYKDLSKKDNYVFFELLAAYTNQYLQKPSKNRRKTIKSD
ncbi:unnamed protein product [Moneuplotes crassus]|uniref:Uncharacterized protein n=1 Tax=Euplotes crassus TaxID=5936 RepID=A0AAD1XM19_EUPCR|nr:unnamed protein product [Moneuplotes crassus]